MSMQGLIKAAAAGVAIFTAIAMCVVIGGVG